MTPDDQDLIRQLKTAVPPWTLPPPDRDLWPRMAARLQTAPRFGWCELALAAAILLAFVTWPEAIPLLLWNL